MIDCGDYFSINRGHQYGKTTTLDALKNALAMDYTVFSISFEGIGNTPFTSEERLCAKFLELLQPTFQSVILAGIYNIKNLQAKIRHDKEHQYNIPWNIAVDNAFGTTTSVSACCCPPF